MTTLYDKIKARILECVKSGESEERDVLKTLLGEVQSKSSRERKEMNDEMIEKTLISFKENAYACTTEGVQKVIGNSIIIDSESEAKSNREIAIYNKFLPKYEDIDSIILFLSPNENQLKEAKSSGVATGMAMGILKKIEVKVRGADVAQAVATIRGS